MKLWNLLKIVGLSLFLSLPTAFWAYSSFWESKSPNFYESYVQLSKSTYNEKKLERVNINQIISDLRSYYFTTHEGDELISIKPLGNTLIINRKKITGDDNFIVRELFKTSKLQEGFWIAFDVNGGVKTYQMAV